MLFYRPKPSTKPLRRRCVWFGVYGEVTESWEEGWSVLAGGYWIPVRLGRRSQSFGTGTERATPASVSAKELAVLAEPKVPILLVLILNFQRTPCGYRATYSDSNGSYDTDSSGDVDDEETKTRRATRGSMSTGRTWGCSLGSSSVLSLPRILVDKGGHGYGAETCDWWHSDFGRTRAFIGTVAMSALETKYWLNIMKAS